MFSKIHCASRSSIGNHEWQRDQLCWRGEGTTGGTQENRRRKDLPCNVAERDQVEVYRGAISSLGRCLGETRAVYEEGYVCSPSRSIPYWWVISDDTLHCRKHTQRSSSDANLHGPEWRTPAYSEHASHPTKMRESTTWNLWQARSLQSALLEASKFYCQLLLEKMAGWIPTDASSSIKVAQHREESETGWSRPRKRRASSSRTVATGNRHRTDIRQWRTRTKREGQVRRISQD